LRDHARGPRVSFHARWARVSFHARWARDAPTRSIGQTRAEEPPLRLIFEDFTEGLYGS